MLDLDQSYYSDDIKAIVGVDEAGRGPLAGPVVAAAVILPKDFVSEDINDSKKLSEKKREELFDFIKENALSYGICFVSADDIDKYNIREATKIAMKGAIAQIDIPYQLIQ